MVVDVEVRGVRARVYVVVDDVFGGGDRASCVVLDFDTSYLLLSHISFSVIVGCG